jgi:hypothetical protein
MGGLSHEQWEIHYRWVEVKALRAVLAADDCSQQQRVRYAARLRSLDKQRTAACADRRNRAAAYKAKLAQAEIDRASQTKLDELLAANRAIADTQETVPRRPVAKLEPPDTRLKCWTVQGFPWIIDKHGKDVTPEGRRIVGEVSMYDAMAALNGCLVLGE